MNTYFKKITTFTKKLIMSFFGFSKESIQNFKTLPKKEKIVYSTGIFLVLLFGVYLAVRKPVTTSAEVPTSRKVVVASVASLSNTEQDLPLIGTVTSVSQATIRSESNGKLTYVNKKLGDMVYAGGVIAEFENSGERASLLQAEGVYEQAKASRLIATLNSGQAGASLGDTKAQTLNAISNAYSTMDDAIHAKTDSVYSQPKFDQVKLLLTLPDSNLSNTLTAKRKDIEITLHARELKNQTLTETSDLNEELVIIQNEVQIIKSYLDDLATAYSKALPDGAFTQYRVLSG